MGGMSHHILVVSGHTGPDGDVGAKSACLTGRRPGERPAVRIDPGSVRAVLRVVSG